MDQFERLARLRQQATDAAIEAARLPARTVVIDNFSGRLAEIADIAASVTRRTTLGRATWEPHDWSDFD